MNIENSLIVLHQESRYQSANINSMSANKKQIKMSIHQLFCVRLSFIVWSTDSLYFEFDYYSRTLQVDHAIKNYTQKVDFRINFPLLVCSEYS